MFNKKKYPNCYEGHQYALDIISGEIPANIWIIGSCKRYLNDMDRIKNDTDCPFYFLPEKAEKFLRIVQKFEHPVGHWETKNIFYESWQKFLWMNIKGFYSKKTKMIRFRTAHIDVGRGNAKALSLKTEIPTPDGLKFLGDLKVGDFVYGREGTPCRIVAETPVHYPNSYRVLLDRGVELFASDKHLWFVRDKSARRREKYAKKRKRNISTEDIKSTKEIIDSGLLKQGDANFSISVFDGPIKNKEKYLPINPYSLGLWLGDGAKDCFRISCSIEDSEETLNNLRNLGEKVSSFKTKGDSGYFTVYDYHIKLRELGVLRNKHIPGQYLNASETQRLELIRGLLDSDGSVSWKNNKGCVSFVSIYEGLIKDVVYLISSLGFKVRYRKNKITSKFKGKNDFYYRLSFTPTKDIDFFKLNRKKNRQVRERRTFTQHDNYYIKDITQVAPMAMKCIQVDSKDGSFLVTRNCVITHNSTMASQAALFDLCCDSPKGNRIYCAATSRDQAKEVFNGSQIMASNNKSFLANFGVEVRAHEILHPASNSYLKAISAQAKSLDGKIGMLVITDELHAMERKTFEVLDSGQSKRKDSLLLSITTAGYMNDGVGYSQRKYAQKVSLGEVEDDTFFAMVFCLDEDDEDIFDPDNWVKANPNLGVSVDPDNFSAKAKKARENPEDAANFKIKHLNMYLDSMNQLMDVKKWKALRDPTLKLDDFKGQKCMVGLDLASKIDITSLCYIFKNGKNYIPFWKNFIPEARVQEVKNRNYLKYIEQGDLIKLPGEVVNLPEIGRIIEQDFKIFKMQEVFFDPWCATELATRLQAKRINMTEFRMNTANLSEPTKKFQANIIEGTFRHNTQDMLEWCLGNIVGKYDAVGNIFPRKEHESMKIDPGISAIMALAGHIQEEEKTSVYEERGIIVL